MSPIAKKLQIKPKTRWLFYNAPDNWLSLLDPVPEGLQFSSDPDNTFDGLLMFVSDSAAITNGLHIIGTLLKPETIFWIAYPKKSSGLNSGLHMMGNWDEPANYGLRIVTSVAINDTWTALRFKFEGLSKLSDSRNDNISKNEYGDYIDVENKQVKLPESMQRILETSAFAMEFYHSLSYSNKKEYVVWILSAKQEKTKEERLARLVGKLLNRKKNPSEK
jgi:hypothetical protein